MLLNIVLISSRYLILIFFALFVLVSFRGIGYNAEDKRNGSIKAQRVFMFLFHFVSYLCIFIHADQDELSFTLGKAIIFYCMQLVYLIVMSCIIPACISLNKGLNNIMCMFIALSFVVQVRLNYDQAFRQFFVLVAATIIFLIIVFFCKRAKFLRNLTWLYCVAGLILLVLVYVLAHVTNGSKLAIDLGFFSFQPMEFVKIIFVFFVASAFNKANNFKTVLITAIFAALHIIILVLCTDLGSALILFVIYVIMVYVATKRFIYVLIGAVGFSAASYIAWKLFGHVQVRIAAWQDPWADINDKGYQIAQSLFAIGTGGWFGTGIFEGSPKYVPEVSNDMVMAAICEEFGGIFAILLIILCLVFALSMMRVAIRVRTVFYKLLAFGLGSVYGMQVFLNIGGTIKFIPLTGVNLPFISSGGSSLISSMILIGIVQALYVISEDDVRKEQEALALGLDIRQFDQEEIHERRVRHDDYPHDSAFSDKYSRRRYDEGSDAYDDYPGDSIFAKKHRIYRNYDEYNDEYNDDVHDADEYGYYESKNRRGIISDNNNLRNDWFDEYKGGDQDDEYYDDHEYEQYVEGDWYEYIEDDEPERKFKKKRKHRKKKSRIHQIDEDDL